jgi:hypothetical protein
MTEVVLESTTVTETLEIVQSLRERLRIDVDFQYKFIQGRYDWGQNEQVDHRTIFYFRDPADATWFRLTYQ